MTKPVTVNPLPEVIIGTMSVCEGLSTALTDATPGGTWSSSDPAVATVDAFGSVTGVAPGTSVISYTLVTGCLRTTTVTVNPAPAPTISGLTSVCPDITETYTTEAGMSNYNWTVTGHSSIISGGTGNNFVEVKWPNAAGTGTVSVNYSNGFGCFATAATVVNVAIGAPPTAAILSGSGVCIGSPSFLSIDVIGGAPPFKYIITELNGGAEVSGYMPGTDIPLGILGATGDYTYNLTLITDNCGTPYSVPSSTTITTT